MIAQVGYKPLKDNSTEIKPGSEIAKEGMMVNSIKC